MIIILIVITAIILLIVAACCKVSGVCSRQEEDNHPCGFCVRWEECNGVDEDCPRRKVDG